MSGLSKVAYFGVQFVSHCAVCAGAGQEECPGQMNGDQWRPGG